MSSLVWVVDVFAVFGAVVGGLFCLLLLGFLVLEGLAVQSEMADAERDLEDSRRQRERWAREDRERERR